MPHELSLPVAHPMREVQSVLHHADCFCASDADEGPRGTDAPQSKENAMKAALNLVAKMLKDEQGGEVLEYALIVGLIVVAAIAAVTSVGTKVLAKWTSLNSSL